MSITSHEDELQELYVRVDRFSAMGSVIRGLIHAVRNPLQGIVIAATSISEDAGDRADPMMAELIETQTNRLSEVLNKLANVYDQYPTARGPLSVAELIEYVVDIQQYQRMPSMVLVRTKVSPDLPLVMANASDVRQATLNIITNAKEAVLDREDGQVWVSAEVDGDDVVITVDDNGPGVDPGIAERLFTPYESTKARPQGGLGLFVARHLVESSGGTVVFGGKGPRAGARFQLRLPAWSEGGP